MSSVGQSKKSHSFSSWRPLCLFDVVMFRFLLMAVPVLVMLVLYALIQVGRWINGMSRKDWLVL